MEIVAADIGGTHARFAIASIASGRVERLDPAVTLRTAEHASLQTAWTAFGERLGRPVPAIASIALASPIGGEVIKLTNNPWVIRPDMVRAQLGVDDFMLVNDFGAVAHAVAQLPAVDFENLCGPAHHLPREGVTTVCGPGTGLGVAQIVWRKGRYEVIETEGGHTDFAPLDAIEDAIIARLRPLLTRVSAERLCSGPGIVAIYETLAALEKRAIGAPDDRSIWTDALAGTDPLAVAALDRFCLALGAVAGDLALAQGANGVAIAGGLGLRLQHRLVSSGFGERFVAKGRFRTMMARIPVKLVSHPEPGLYGAAAAFAQSNG